MPHYLVFRGRWPDLEYGILTVWALGPKLQFHIFTLDSVIRSHVESVRSPPIIATITNMRKIKCCLLVQPHPPKADNCSYIQIFLYNILVQT
jgi:hypothetical protein